MPLLRSEKIPLVLCASEADCVDVLHLVKVVVVAVLIELFDALHGRERARTREVGLLGGLEVAKLTWEASHNVNGFFELLSLTARHAPGNESFLHSANRAYPQKWLLRGHPFGSHYHQWLHQDGRTRFPHH